MISQDTKVHSFLVDGQEYEINLDIQVLAVADAFDAENDDAEGIAELRHCITDSLARKAQVNVRGWRKKDLTVDQIQQKLDTKIFHNKATGDPVKKRQSLKDRIVAYAKQNNMSHEEALRDLLG